MFFITVHVKVTNARSAAQKPTTLFTIAAKAVFTLK